MSTSVKINVPNDLIGENLDEMDSMLYSFETKTCKDKALEELDKHMLQVISYRELENLKISCDASKLDIYDEKCSLDKVFVTIPKRSPDQMKLESLDAITDKNETTDDYNFSTFSSRIENPAVNLSYKKHLNNETNLESFPKEIVVTVLIYKPHELTYRHRKLLTVQQRIEILGSQTLDDLQKSIYCSECEFHLGDRSNCLDINTDIETRSNQIYSRNIFHLEEIFSDQDFESKHKVVYKKSQETLIKDLKIALGKDYVYQHVGDCFHSVIFSDAKLLDRFSCMDLTKYPLLTGRSRVQRMICVVCNRLSTKWLVKNAEDYFFIDPAYVCDVCLKGVLYDEAGNKVNQDFQVYLFNYKSLYDN